MKLGGSRSAASDTEYSGREGQIKGLLLEFIHRWDPDLPKETIVFRQVGKKSRSHKLAWETQKGKRKPDRTVTTEELLQYC